MKLAHIADVHLGFRQYQRQNRHGINQREADVALAFRNAIDGVIAQEPDLLVIAGDLFHSVRPTNPAILHAFNQFRRLRQALPDMPVLVIAGNHDTPRSVETGSILRLFESFERFEVAWSEARRVEFPDLDLSVLCVPHSALMGDDRPALVPDPDWRYNVLVTHGEVAGIIPRDEPLEFGGALIEPEELKRESWSYVALGHYHVAHRVGPNAWFPGAVEYVSTNPWGEMKLEKAAGRPGKGWLLVGIGEKLEVEFQSIELARRHVDLKEVWGSGKVPGEIDAEIANRVDSVKGGIAHDVVRLVVRDVPRGVARDLNHERIREYKAAALNFNLDIRRPQSVRDTAVGSPGRHQTIPELVLEYLSRRPLDSDIDREKVVALARKHLEAIEDEGGEG